MKLIFALTIGMCISGVLSGFLGLADRCHTGFTNYYTEPTKSLNVRLVDCIDSCCRVEVRLHTSSSMYSKGKLNAGEWGTVCNDGWDNEDANVVCAEMGCSNGYIHPQHMTTPGTSPQRIWMSNVACTGSEESLTDCPMWGTRTWGQVAVTDGGSCSHYEDAGVCCMGYNDEKGYCDNVIKCQVCPDGKTSIHTLREGEDVGYHNDTGCRDCPVGKFSNKDMFLYGRDGQPENAMTYAEYIHQFPEYTQKTIISRTDRKIENSRLYFPQNIIDLGSQTVEAISGEIKELRIDAQDHCMYCPQGFEPDKDRCVACKEDKGTRSTYNPKTHMKTVRPNFLRNSGFYLFLDDDLVHGGYYDESGTLNYYDESGLLPGKRDGEVAKCIDCPQGQTLEGPICKDCEAGKYKEKTGKSECTKCSEVFPGSTSSEVGSKSSSDCNLCSVGYTYDGADSLFKCKTCEAGKHGQAVGPRPIWSAEGVCIDCGVGKYQARTGKTECDLCPKNTKCPENGTGVELKPKDCQRNEFSLEGSTVCHECNNCDIGQYLEDCSSEKNHSGVCRDCQTCQNVDELLVGCDHRGFNSAHRTEPASGICKKTKYLSPTAMCQEEVDGLIKSDFPSIDRNAQNQREKTIVIGTSMLSGYNFQEVFGAPAHGRDGVDFVCSQICNGQQEWDTMECGGPYACKTQACAMEISTDSFQTPRACPVVITEEDTIAQIVVKQQQECIDCTKCGKFSNPDEVELSDGMNEYIIDWGRGCAQECSRILCDNDEIYDWTDTRLGELHRCKKCSELSDARLCTTANRKIHELATTDVSGNRPLLVFNDCKGLNGVEEVTYGQCGKCKHENIMCEDGRYLATCPTLLADETISKNMKGKPSPGYSEAVCPACVPRDGMPVAKSSQYVDENGRYNQAYCQVFACEADRGDKFTGVRIDGAVCNKACKPKTCQPGETPVSCLLPHDNRCVSAYPAIQGADDAGYSRNDVVPIWANMLESISESAAAHQFASFENVLVDLSEMPPHLHQCVWNAIHVTDNSMNPGGASAGFYRDSETVSGHVLFETGSKMCTPILIANDVPPPRSGVWRKNPSLEYPLLPLQNTVAFKSEFPRRVLLNTSASVMQYWRDGNGYNGNRHGDKGYFKAIKIIEPPARIPSPGDLFLNINLQQSREAALRVFVPTDRNISHWVPGWRFGFAVKESTDENYRDPIEVNVKSSIVKVREDTLSITVKEETDFTVIDKFRYNTPPLLISNGLYRVNPVPFYKMAFENIVIFEVGKFKLFETYKFYGFNASKNWCELGVNTCEKESITIEKITSGGIDTEQDIRTVVTGAYCENHVPESIKKCDKWIYQEGLKTSMLYKEGDEQLYTNGYIDFEMPFWNDRNVTLVSKKPVPPSVVFKQKKYNLINFFSDKIEKWHYVTYLYTGSESDCETSCRYRTGCRVYAYTKPSNDLKSLPKCFLLLSNDDFAWRKVGHEKIKKIFGKLTDDHDAHPYNFNYKELEHIPPIFVLGVTDRFKEKKDDVVMIGKPVQLLEDQVVVNIHTNTDRCLAYYSDKTKVYCVKQTGIQNMKPILLYTEEIDNSKIISFTVRKNIISTDSDYGYGDSITLLCHNSISISEDEDAEDEDVTELYTLKEFKVFDNRSAVSNFGLGLTAVQDRATETDLMRIAVSETGIVGLMLTVNSAHLVYYDHSMNRKHVELTVLMNSKNAQFFNMVRGESRQFSAVNTHHASGRVVVLFRGRVGVSGEIEIKVYIVGSLLEDRRILGNYTMNEKFAPEHLTHQITEHNEVIFVSTAWTHENSVVVGFSGVVYRVNVIDIGVIEVVKIENCFLSNTHFARSHAAYIQIPYLLNENYEQDASISSKFVRTCALLNGFVELTDTNNHNETGYIALRGRLDDVSYKIPKVIYEVPGTLGASNRQYIKEKEAYNQSSQISSNFKEIVNFRQSDFCKFSSPKTEESTEESVEYYKFFDLGNRCAVTTVEVTVVLLVINVPFTVQEFGDEKQTQFKTAIANTAKVDDEFVFITDITPNAVLTSGVSVSTQITITFTDADRTYFTSSKATSVVNRMILSNINTYMQSFGIGLVTVSKEASVGKINKLQGSVGTGSDRQVRLVDCRFDGCCRVEVLHASEWGTVCSDSWDNVDATVVCRELQCSGGTAVKGFGALKPGANKIWMDEVECTGNEETVVSCTFNRFHPIDARWGEHNCPHSQDAGVCCTDIEIGSGSCYDKMYDQCFTSSSSCQKQAQITSVCMQIDIPVSTYMTINTPADSYVRIHVSGNSDSNKYVAQDGNDIRIDVTEDNMIIYGTNTTSGIGSLETKNRTIHLCNGAAIVTSKKYNASDVPLLLDKYGLRYNSNTATLRRSETELDTAWKYVHTFLSFSDIESDNSFSPMAISVHLRRTEADDADGNPSEKLEKQRTVAIDALTLLPVLSMGALIRGCEIPHGLGPSCGDGARSKDEECDDGGTTNNDGCSSQCTVEDLWDCSDVLCGFSRCSRVCGDGVRSGKEQCDDGNLKNDDGCSDICTIECGWGCPDGKMCEIRCGDGFLHSSEQCDDNNELNNDGCSSVCTVEQGWTCITVLCGLSQCNITCGDGGKVCGDGVQIYSEECDDGNTRDNDGCNSKCKIEIEDDWQCHTYLCAESVCGICGDGLLTANEKCDYGEQTIDGCSDECTVECGWRCTTSINEVLTCFQTGCGDGFQDLAINEECDDGNQVDDDGCNTMCKLEYVNERQWHYDKIKNDDGCDGITIFDGYCGDGNINDDYETCDDDNFVDGDGCSIHCTIECGWGCEVDITGKSNCTHPCGDGIFHEETEECDHGVDDNCCDGMCRLQNGCELKPDSPWWYLQVGSRGTCKSGRAVGICGKMALCGDGIRDSINGEECDDGNIDNRDGCDDKCKLECGDGIRCTNDRLPAIQCAGRDCHKSTCYIQHKLNPQNITSRNEVWNAFYDDSEVVNGLAMELSNQGQKLDALKANYEKLRTISESFPVYNKHDYSPGLMEYLQYITKEVEDFSKNALRIYEEEHPGRRLLSVAPPAREGLMSVDTRHASVRDMPLPTVASVTNASDTRTRRLLTYHSADPANAVVAPPPPPPPPPSVEADTANAVVAPPSRSSPPPSVETDTASAVVAPRFQYQSLVYVPTNNQLEELQLTEVLHGDNEKNWERLHVTVALEWARPQSGAWAVSVQHVKVDEEMETVTYSNKSALHRLGCAIVAVDDTYAVCHLEIPTALAETHELRAVIITAVQMTAEAAAAAATPAAVGAAAEAAAEKAARAAAGNCDAPERLSVLLEPFTTIFRCEEDSEFWDYQLQECVKCSLVDDGSGCAEGFHIKGCNALMYTENTEMCEPCKEEINSETETWQPGAVCTKICLLGNFYDGSASSPACTPCSPEIPAGNCTFSQEPQKCSVDRDVHCGDCPAIDKSVFSKYERFAFAIGMNCHTECVDDAYRQNVTGNDDIKFYCKPCTAPAVFIAQNALQSQGSFLQFSACGNDADSEPSECPQRDHSIVTGHARAANASCLYKCVLGAHRVHSNASDRHHDAHASEKLCTKCDALLDYNGSVVPPHMYTVTSLECAFECHDPYHAHNGSCHTCEGDRCEIGEYLHNCSKCLNCTSAGPHFTFTGSGVWDATSCKKECDPGFWDDFGTCSKHTTHAVLAESCPAHTYIRNGTAALDTACMPCKRCEGQNQTRNCLFAHNSECSACNDTLRLDEFVGTRCAQRCTAGRLHFGKEGSCGVCSHACPPGQHFTVNRTSCEDCRNCSRALPTGNVWVSGCVSRKPSTVASSQANLAADLMPIQYCTRSEYLFQITNGAVCVSCHEFDDPTRPPIRFDFTWAWADAGATCAWQCMPGLTRFAGPTPGSMRCSTNAAGASAANTAEVVAAAAPVVVNTVSETNKHLSVLESFGSFNMYLFFGAIAVGVVFVSYCF